MASGAARGAEVVVVTGASSPLGRRVCALAAADPLVARVVALDDVRTVDLKPLVEGATVIVHLAQDSAPRPDPEASEVGDSAVARRVLDAASAVGPRHLVLLSSATVYGAWANNPIPLTEEAPLRPNVGVALASEMADMERAAADWSDAHPAATVAILRPTVTVASEGNGWLAKALARSTSLPVTDEEPPGQFLDVADLASAVDLARRARLEGPRNVAPDGWISGDTVRALAGGPPRVRLPERLALRVAGLGWRWGLTATPPALLPLTVHPWVIANDRLRADGWEPTSSNEEAYVGAHRAGPWATLSPRRRQELTLGVSGALAVGLVVFAVARLRRRHPS